MKRWRLLASAGIIAVAITMGGFVPSAAQQVAIYESAAWGTCMADNFDRDHIAYMLSCDPDSSFNQWYVDIIREPQSHNGHVVRLRSVAMNRCLDSNGNGVGDLPVDEEWKVSIVR
jgi:hypothetical protein